MSHFSVLVVLDGPPTEDAIKKALQPFHEFECTGMNDEFVQDVDLRPEAFASYGAATLSLVIERPDGTLAWPFTVEGGLTPEFEPYWAKDAATFNLPDGYIKHRNRPASSILSFLEWVRHEYRRPAVAGLDAVDRQGAHKHGWMRVRDGQLVELVKRTNPNKRWDWWQIGGRWHGLLNVQPNEGTIDRSIRGEKPAAYGEYQVDGALIADLDLAAMKARAVEARDRLRSNARAKFGDGDMEAAYAALCAAKAVWRSLPEPRPRGDAFSDWLRAQPNGDAAARFNAADFWESIDPAPGQTIQEWVDGAPALSAYAFLKDGNWQSRGEMGWFGVSRDDRETWDADLQAMIAGLRPDQSVTIVDCHI